MIQELAKKIKNQKSQTSKNSFLIIITLHKYGFKELAFVYLSLHQRKIDARLKII